jgi:hypothetical protein
VMANPLLRMMSFTSFTRQRSRWGRQVPDVGMGHGVKSLRPRDRVRVACRIRPAPPSS